MSGQNHRLSHPKNSTTVRNIGEPPWLLHGLRLGFRVLARTAPDVASAAAERLFRSPRRHRRPAWEQDVLAEATPFRLPWGAETLPAWSWGRGPVILLVHGWEGRGSQLGAFVDPLVEMGFRVVAFDAPGHGDGPSRSATMIEIARAITSAADEVGPLHAIVAHSVGCAAATYAVARMHGRAPRLAFVAPPTSPLRFTQFFAAKLGIDEDVRARMVVRLEERYGVPFGDLDALAHAPRMTAPLLVVHDEDDHEVSLASGAALTSRWPGARLVTTKGLGHRRILRAPHVVAEVTSFVAGSPLSMRTGLPGSGLDRELFERERRHAGDWCQTPVSRSFPITGRHAPPRPTGEARGVPTPRDPPTMPFPR